MHYYIKENGKSKRWNPLKKDGTPYKRITQKMASTAGAVIGITTQLKNHLDSGFLFTWAGRLGIESAFEAVYEYAAGVLGLSDAQVFKDIPEATQELASEIFTEKTSAAANRGTEIHDGIDAHLTSGAVSDDAVVAKAQKNVKQWLADRGVKGSIHTEHCVVFNGGISIPADKGTGIRTTLTIHNGATADLITKRLVADWKTVEMAKNGQYYTSKPEHCAQLAFCRHAAYNESLCDHDAECWNVYIDRNSGEIVKAVQWNEEQLWAALEFVGWCWETDRALAKLNSLI